jgi:cytochrome c-type biogenesis protein CcmE
MDTLGNTARVVYHAEKPYDLEKAERITLKGKMDGDIFNGANGGILLKCPSKYKDDPSSNQRALSQN